MGFAVGERLARITPVAEWLKDGPEVAWCQGDPERSPKPDMRGTIHRGETPIQPTTFRAGSRRIVRSRSEGVMVLNPLSRKVWSTARVRVWPEPIVLATFPRLAGDRVAAFAGRVGVRDTNAFVAFLTEGDECTLSAPESAFAAWRQKTRATETVAGLRAFTIEARMPVDIVGFLAPLAERLAEARIPIIPQCGFRTDHLLVPGARLDDALRVVHEFIALARSTTEIDEPKEAS
jgi:hypothetical protein